MACLYKRRRKYWVSYMLGGRLVQKSLKTDNERIAKDKLKQIEYELSVGELYGITRLPLPMILEGFCRHLMATRTYKSWKNDLSRLRVLFGPVCEPLKPGFPGCQRDAKTTRVLADRYAGKHIQGSVLEDITPQVINRFITDRMAQNAWKPKTANHTRITLHRLFAYAIKHHGFVSRDRRYPNPAKGVERFKEMAPDITFLKLDEIDAQLKALREDATIHGMVAVYIYAGLRREEAVWLTHEDVDLKNRLLRIRAKTIDDEFWQPKTKRNRVVPISDALFAILTAYQAPHECLWFFPSPNGKRWDVDNFSQDLAKLNKTHNLGWSCLDFRHTFGSQLAQKGESLYKISTLMGNSPEICRKHYAALIPEEMAEVVEFGRPQEATKPDPDDTKAMLKAILQRLEAGENKLADMPHLRVVRPTVPA
ncbi:MAG: tyrosine-type recombinase/integrase [Phycisphaerae bacterium]